MAESAYLQSLFLDAGGAFYLSQPLAFAVIEPGT